MPLEESQQQLNCSCAQGSGLNHNQSKRRRKADIGMLPDAGIAGPVASANAASATPTGCE